MNTSCVYHWYQHTDNTTDVRLHLTFMGGHYSISFRLVFYCSLVYSHFQALIRHHTIHANLIPNLPPMQSLTWHPFFSAKTRHWFTSMTSLIKIVPVTICRTYIPSLCRTHFSLSSLNCFIFSFCLRISSWWSAINISPVTTNTYLHYEMFRTIFFTFNLIICHIRCFIKRKPNHLTRIICVF